MAPTTKRTRLSIQEKLEVADAIASGRSYAELERKYGVKKRTLTRIKKEAPTIRKKSTKNALSAQLKSVCDLRFPEIDGTVLAFVTFCRKVKKPVTLAALSARALLARDKLVSKCTCEEEKARLKSFTASKKWCISFTKRHALRSVAMHGEAGSASPIEVAKEIAELREKLLHYPVQNIYNVDETGLFYKLIPRRTYVLESEGKKSVRGTKAIKAKDRVTAFCCTNADGTDKVEFSIIGKSKNPRCFRSGEPAVRYFSQKNAWSDAEVFRSWFYDLFLPHIRKRTSAPVALLMDNCGAHGSDLHDCREQVTIFPLPPNCTSIHQPMDMGVIAAWKALYRRNLLLEIIGDIETQEQRRKKNEKRPAGMKGLEEGYDPHMLDVARLSDLSWSQVTEETIARCWVKAKVLPEGAQAELQNKSGKRKAVEKSEEVDKIVAAFKNISLEGRSVMLRDSDMETTPTREQISTWIEIEEEPDVQEALVDDALDEEKEEESAVPGVYATDSGSAQILSEAPEADEADSDAVHPIPSSASLIDTFSEVEELCYKTNTPRAAEFVRKARHVLDAERRRRQGSSSRQLMLTEVWRKTE